MPAIGPALTTTWRNDLQAGQAALRLAFEQGEPIPRLLRRHCRLVDDTLRRLWRQAGLQRSLSLVAVGGYGRGELFPHSDVDLLILLPDRHDGNHDAALERLVGLFWDIGLAVGHSVRTVGECLAEAAGDVSVHTSLLEARWLAGERRNVRRLRTALAGAARPVEFLHLKLLEQRQRHARFNDTAYNLEPNIKESPGGMRDLQNILWVSMGCGLGGSWRELVVHGLLTDGEARQIRHHELFLQMLRVRLHYLAGRREDRLLFDFQETLARELGLAGTPRKRASEQLMQRYYRSAKFIGLMNDILLQALEERLQPGTHAASPVDAWFAARNGRLELRAADLLEREPGALLEAFLVLQRNPQLTGFSASMLRAVWRAHPRVDRRFRQDPANRRRFLDILRLPRGTTDTLRRINRYGVLGRYIPAFGRIVGQMQHDLFHVYTVDEHILHVLGNLRRFTAPEHRHEFPLCSQLMAEFPQPELLYIAALFHDIAKGRGGDHSLLGMADARRFCRQHGLGREETALVAWLVEQHLVMSGTAQKSDLSDPAVIAAFAARMGTERRLTALYLLTVADIRGTSQAIWNAWKARLLEQLFNATRRHLLGNPPDRHGGQAACRRQAEERLSYYGIVPEAYRALWHSLGDTYFQRYEAHEIAWHTRMLLRHADTRQPVVRARLSPGGDGIQVMIYLPEQEALFARICSFFERLGYNIVEARIHTTRHGYALDSFLVLHDNGGAMHYRDLLNYIEYELAHKLMQAHAPEKPMQGRVSRQLRHFPIAPEVRLAAAREGYYELDIVAGDRPGLLSRIAQTLLRHGVRLSSAKINTLGERAEDTFLIASASGTPLAETTLHALRDELLEQLK